MKFSAKTLAILKNFQALNPSIAIKEGSVVSTLSKANIIGVATVEEVFTQNFAIGDLSTFLGCMSVFNEPELTFHGDYMTITQGNQTVRYTFCEPRTVLAPPQNSIPTNDIAAIFSLKSSDIKSLSRSTGLLNTPEIRIISEHGHVVVKTCDDRNPSGNEYSFIGPETDKTFNFLFKKETITLLMEQDYEVTLDRSGIVKFKNDTITYFIAGQAKK